MIAIDTNLIVRYLTGDHREQSSRARKIIDRETVFVAVTVMLETAWFLRSAYGYAEHDVIHALRAFCGLETVNVEASRAVATALGLAEGGMDFADALHLAQAFHCENFLTFDRKFITAAEAAGFEIVREA